LTEDNILTVAGRNTKLVRRVNMDKETKKVTYYIPIDLYERLRLNGILSKTREPQNSSSL
jgi:hypothetical protein